jgi:hypothetical protein
MRAVWLLLGLAVLNLLILASDALFNVVAVVVQGP